MTDIVNEGPIQRDHGSVFIFSERGQNLQHDLFDHPNKEGEPSE